jgi:hypothetical protein
MTKTQMFDKDGKPIHGDILPDGGRLRTHMLMMDSAQPDIAAITRAAIADTQPPQTAMHRPGSAALTDTDRDAREKARDARKASLSDAWRNPPTLDAAQIERPAPTTPTGEAADRRDARLRDAWKGVN